MERSITLLVTGIADNNKGNIFIETEHSNELDPHISQPVEWVSPVVLVGPLGTYHQQWDQECDTQWYKVSKHAFHQESFSHHPEPLTGICFVVSGLPTQKYLANDDITTSGGMLKI